MANTFFQLSSFAQANDKDEFDALIAELETKTGTKDIWSFLQRSATTIGRFIEGAAPSPFAEFHATWHGKAADMITGFTPADPDNPTSKEQARIDGMVAEFTAAFAPAKAQAIRAALENVRPKNGNDWRMIEAAATLAEGDARSAQNEAFWDALAGYYLTTAAQYVAARAVRYRFLGRVLDSNNGSAPLEDVRVACADKAFEVPRQFGITSTNREGYYRVEFTVLEGTTVAYPLTFTFTHPELSAPEVHAMSFVPDAKVPVTKSLAFTPLPSTSKTIASTSISIPADVQAYLTANSITVTRLEDIRRMGGFRNIPGVNTGNADLKKLDSLASLELVQEDLAKNNTLISRGYESITDIALAPQGIFVEENSDLFNDFGAGAIHYMAKAGHMHGVNQIASANTPAPVHSGSTPAAEGGARNCDCPDCKSGVSPLAYLADLLAYTKQHIRVGTGQISFAYLQSNFKQPFVALRKSCSQMKERLCQNRIAAEVLRAYLQSNPLTGEPATAFAAEEKEYLMQAYELLLGKLGTSYSELRITRANTDEKVRQRLANRMGVVRTDTNGPTLEQVLIDLSNTANIVEGQNAGAATGLEQLFGLRNTKRPMLEAVPESKVEQWKKAKLREEWKEGDGLSTPYWKLNAVDREVIIDPDVITADDFRTPQTGNAVFDLWVKRRKWVDDEWAALDGESTAVDVLDLIKADRMIIANRRNYLLPNLSTPLTYSTSTPVAFSQAFTVLDQFYADGQTYYRIAEEPPQDMFNGTLSFPGATPPQHENPLRAVRSAVAMIERLIAGDATQYNNSDVLIGWTEPTASALIESLRDAIALNAEGDPAGIVAIEQRGFDLASASRIVALFDLHMEDPVNWDKGGGLSEAEWDEFKNILIQVLKRKLSESTWRTEENQNLLSPVHFRPAIHGPREGSYPYNRTVALIDPDVVTARDLPEVTALFYQDAIGADDARAVLEARKEELADDRDALVTAHGGAFQALLNAAFITPGLDWDTDPAENDYLILLNDLASAQRKGWANMFLSLRLKLTETELRQVVSIGTKEAEPDTELTQGEKDGLYNTLLRAHKQLKRLAPTGTDSWVEEEYGVSQWKLRKAALPKWRASQAQRDAWLAALAEHSERPIIDADLIGPAELQMPEDGNLAYGLFNTRWQQMHGTAEYPGTAADGWLHDISSLPLDDTADFNALTIQELGFVEPSLSYIREQQADGTDIRPRIAQLNLTAAEFNRLMACYDLLVAESALTVEEKSIVYRILAQVKKRRNFFAYRLAETEAGLTLSQDHFKLREQPITSFPPQPDTPLTEWLAEERDLILWRRRLKGRVEQEKSVLNDWQEALFEVDEAMMVHLRDAMVRAISPVGQNLVVSARALGDKLLIDLENNCCYKTNRVAAAIETLQQFLWKTRTKDIEANYPTVRYQGEDFDEAWTWMGSYANWRAAMFVFLYPENVLHPSLRKNATPAFREVIEATRNNRRFGPNDACEVAHRYSEYVRDISELDVKCAQMARAFVGEDRCGAPRNAPQKLSFVFAQARGSKRPYFSIADTNDPAAVSQTAFWAEIPGIGEKPTLRGCDLYDNSDQKINHIYLFYTLEGPDNKSKFFAQRYSLETMQWEEEAIEFDVEQDELTRHPHVEDPTGFNKEDFDTSIRALCVLKNSEQWASPILAISLRHKDGDAYTFTRFLAGDGKSLQGGEDWNLWKTSFANPTGSLKGDVLDYWSYYPSDQEGWIWTEVFHFFLLRYWNATDKRWVTQIVRVKAGASFYASYQRIYVTEAGQTIPAFTSLLVDNGTKHFYAFSRDAVITDDWDSIVWVFDEAVFDHPPIESPNLPTEIIPSSLSGLLDTTGVLAIPIRKMNARDADTSMVIYQRRSDSKLNICRAAHDSTDNEFRWGPIRYRLSMKLRTEPSIGPAYSDANQGVNTIISEEAWLDNSSLNRRLLVPVMEAWYFVPLQIALQLQVNGYYTEALDWFRSMYDFRRPLGERKISYFLTKDETINTTAERLEDWYADPLNPHAIAATRKHTYTRYTILSIVNCLLAYADAEFTVDDSETVPHARELYEDALALMGLLVAQGGCADEAVHEALNAQDMAPAWRRVWLEVLARLEPLVEWSGYAGLLEDITDVLEGGDPISEQLAAVNDLIDAAVTAFVPLTIEAVLDANVLLIAAETAAALGSLEADLAVQQLLSDSQLAYQNTMVAVTGIPVAELEAATIPWLVDDREPSGFSHGHEIEYISPGKEEDVNAYSVGQPAKAYHLNNPFPNVWLSGVPFSFCVVPNPMVGALVMKAEVELWKIHNCMNIAGMVRELDPFAAPTDSTTGIPVIGAAGGSIAIPSSRNLPPSAYRYRTLVERTKQLVAMAQQVEAAFLATLEKLDAERYSQFRAQQDIETSKANIKLQDLKLKEADNGIQLANLQRERAELQVKGLKNMIDEGLLGSEIGLISVYSALAALEITRLALQTAEKEADSAIKVAAATVGQAAAAMASALGSVARGFDLAAAIAQVALNTTAQILSLTAAFERRKQEWEYQRTLAQHDVTIGKQQVKLAEDRKRIVGQERQIAVLQNEHARATLDFLRNKFTSAELYEWMSQVLEDAYSWFLQEATAMALLAERQLAFERQVDMPPFIKTDYWLVGGGGSLGGLDPSGQGNTDRRGLTGSTRLLKDLTELDQYAFSTNSPKLQLTKTIALSELAPEELLNLRNTGIARFYTTQEHFDRDYPGHYLRLTKRVSVTVIALTPPTKGIRATLANGGTSQVVVGGTIFQDRAIKRYPEVVAFSSGVGDHGVFQLQADGEFLHPFEGSGVETAWEFRMEKAANPFDFNSIADVLFTIEYESLNSFIYRNTVAQRLNQEGGSSAIAISLKNNLPDQWFDLHNPPEPTIDYQVSFQIGPRDIAPNLSAPMISRIVAFAVMKDSAEVFPYNIGLEKGDAVEPNAAFSESGIAILSNDGDEDPIGTWSLGFRPEAENMTNPFAEKLVDDIFIVISYTGESTKYLMV